MPVRCRCGKDVAAIRKAVADGDVEMLAEDRVRVGALRLEADEHEHRSTAAEGYAIAEDHDWVVAVSTEVTVHWQAAGELAEAIDEHADAISGEVLATTVERSDVDGAQAFEIEGHAATAALERARV